MIKFIDKILKERRQQIINKKINELKQLKELFKNKECCATCKFGYEKMYINENSGYFDRVYVVYCRRFPKEELKRPNEFCYEYQKKEKINNENLFNK